MERLQRVLGVLADVPGWAMILALLAVGVGAGWLCERLLVRWARRAERRTAAGWYDVLLGSVHRLPIVWFAGAALYLGVSLAGYGGPVPNLVGMQIIMSRQIRLGDYVALSTGEEGAVTDIQARNTTIRTFPERNRVLVPNSILASTVVTNYSLPRKRLFITLPIGVAYDSDLEKVEAVTLDVANEVLSEVEGGLTDEEPFVRFEEFSDFSINFLLRVHVREFTDQFLIRHELVKRLHERYGAEGIEIPFPIRTVYMRERRVGS